MTFKSVEGFKFEDALCKTGAFFCGRLEVELKQEQPSKETPVRNAIRQKLMYV